MSIYKNLYRQNSLNMKKTLKIIGWTILSTLVLVLGYGTYIYQSSPWLKAVVNNDESKIFYRPVKEMKDMGSLEYSENVLKIEDSAPEQN